MSINPVEQMSGAGVNNANNSNANGDDPVPVMPSLSSTYTTVGTGEYGGATSGLAGIPLLMKEYDTAASSLTSSVSLSTTSIESLVGRKFYRDAPKRFV